MSRKDRILELGANYGTLLDGLNAEIEIRQQAEKRAEAAEDRGKILEHRLTEMTNRMIAETAKAVQAEARLASAEERLAIKTAQAQIWEARARELGTASRRRRGHHQAPDGKDNQSTVRNRRSAR